MYMILGKYNRRKNMFNFAKILLVFAALISLPLTAFSADSLKAIPTVNYVDLESYVGLWYENYRIRNEFQDNEPVKGDGPCFNTTAEYSFLPKGKIQVKNTCFKKSRVVVGKARATTVPGSNNSKLKVNFTGIPFFEWLGIGNGDYWILALGPKNTDRLYSWVLVGSPNLKYGWILSRNPILADADLEAALRVAESVGYDIESFKSFQK